MNKAILLAALPILSGALAAQSNVVPGLDGRLTDVNNLTYQGRRGPAHPNGEIGMSMLNSMCNPGSVEIPWFQAMNPDHPKFGFLLVRLSGDRMEQISDWSYCKHAFVSVNVSSTCGTCIVPSVGGAKMGIHCSDTYSEGNNASRYYLGPPEEIDPWLGTWNPIGSYFDRGDPAVGGAAATDGVRSLSNAQVNAFDAVKNLVTVQEPDLSTPGASYFYGIQLIHQGESVLNRGDNNASRGCTPVWNGSSWSFNNAGSGMPYGSILQHWPNATLHEGQNGNDDGRFVVAVKVSALSGGMWHYEYGVHNIDNNRGGATFRVPVDAGATVTNYSFRDIDHNPLDQWLGAVSGNEIVFTAPGNNPLNWNTIYNFGFDCSVAPSSGTAWLDEARIGPGALAVAVQTKVPSGIPGADLAYVGQGCGGCQDSVYDFGAMDLANQGFKLTYGSGSYALGAASLTYIAPASGNLNLGDDTEATLNLPFAFPYNGGTATSLRVCSNGFVSVPPGNGNSYTPTVSEFLAGVARWAPCWRDLNPGAGGAVYGTASASEARITWVGVPNYGQGGTSNTFQLVFQSNGSVTFLYQAMDASTALFGYTRGSAVDPGATDLSASLGSGLVLCPLASSSVSLAASGLPVLGSTVTFTTSAMPAPTYTGFLILSLTAINPGVELGFLGMPNCYLYQNLDILQQFATPGSSATTTWSVPITAALAGTVVHAQSATLSPGFNSFGFLTSNGAQLTLGL